MNQNKLIYKSARYLSSLSIESITKVNCYKEIECINLVRSYNVNFPLGFVLHTFSYLKDVNEFKDFIKVLITKAQQEGITYSYNYFTKEYNLINKNFILPSDLDDTSLMLSALIKNDISIDPEFFLQIINLESSEGGPYITWYLPKEEKYIKWMDVDPVVNAHLLYLCSLNGLKLDSTHKYLINSLKTNKIESPYYPGILYFFFYSAKYVSINDNKKLKNLLISRLNKFNFEKLNKIEKIIYGLSLNYLGIKLSTKNFNEIKKFQQLDGSITELGICLDYPAETDMTYTSNKAVTTALWLELIIKQEDSIIKSSYIKSSSGKTKKRNAFTKIIYARTIKLITSELSKTNFNKIILKDYPLNKEYKVITLPILLALDLKKDFKETEMKLLVNFCCAGYFGWIGYSILDDFIDDKQWSTILPIVNYLMRIQYSYLNLLFNKKTLKEILSSFLITDEFYYKEGNGILEAKNFNYIEKRMKAFLILIKLLPTVLSYRNFTNISNDLYILIKNIQIIDQLNDDAHDWEEDLKNQITTYITYKIKKEKVYLTDSNNKNVFWEKVMPDFIKTCNKLYLESKAIVRKHNYENLEQVLEFSYKPIKIAEEEMLNINKIFKKLL